MNETPSRSWEPGLTKFVARWGQLTTWMGAPDVIRLRTFLNAVRPLLNRDLAAHTVASREIDLQRLQIRLSVLSTALAAHSGTSTLLNPWSIAGLKRHEVRNAAALAALWSPATCGLTGIAFLNAFLRLLPGQEDLPSFAQLGSHYHVRTEHCAAGMTSERVDLTIEGADFVLGIEVKIDAPEGPDQLGRYLNTVQRWGVARHKPAAVILLAPFLPKQPEVFSADWGNVIDAARSVLPQRRRDYNFHHYLIHSFALHLAPLRKARS